MSPHRFDSSKAQSKIWIDPHHDAYSKKIGAAYCVERRKTLDSLRVSRFSASSGFHACFSSQKPKRPSGELALSGGLFCLGPQQFESYTSRANVTRIVFVTTGVDAYFIVC
jgi:hypothetical protein